MASEDSFCSTYTLGDCFCWGLFGLLGSSIVWSPRWPPAGSSVRPGTGRESVKKKRDLAAGASGLASFPRSFPLAFVTGLVSTVLREEAATLSSLTLIPKSTVNTNTNSSYSTAPGNSRTDNGLRMLYIQRPWCRLALGRAPVTLQGTSWSPPCPLTLLFLREGKGRPVTGKHTPVATPSSGNQICLRTLPPAPWEVEGEAVCKNHSYLRTTESECLLECKLLIFSVLHLSGKMRQTVEPTTSFCYDYVS